MLEIKTMKNVLLVHGAAFAFMFTLTPLIMLGYPQLVSIPVGWLLNVELLIDDNVYSRSYGNQSSMGFLMNVDGENVRLIPLGLLFIANLLYYFLGFVMIFLSNTIFVGAKFYKNISRPCIKFFASFLIFLILLKIDPTGFFRGLFTFTLF